MHNQNLKLVNDRIPDTLPFNRRVCPRHAMSGQVTAVGSMPEAGPAIKKICSLRLLNMSDSGLGVLTDEVLPVNSTITVFFPPHGPERGFDVKGRVVRCHRRDDGHEIGISFDDRAAA